MYQKQLASLFTIFMLLVCSVVMAQQEKKSLTNADIVTMIKAGLPESTIVLSIQQSPSNFDTSPDALIQLKNQGATAKILDSILQAQSSKSATIEKQQISGNSNQPAVAKASVYDFNFELASCISSGGDSITCTFTVTNKDKVDKELHISGSSRLIDEFGNEYPVAERTLGKETYKDEFLFARMVTMIPEVSVVASIKFVNIKSAPKLIKALRITCIGDRKDFNVDLLNIPLNGSSQKSLTHVGSNASRDLMLGMSFYERGNPEQSFEPLFRAITSGEKAVVIAYHRINGPGLGLDDDMYAGHLYISKDTLEFRSAGSLKSLSGMQRVAYRNFKIPMNKILLVKVEPKKQGRLTLEIMLGDEKGKKEEKKIYNFYPQTAELLNTGRSGPYWEIRCADCQQKSEMLAKLLQKLAGETADIKAAVPANMKVLRLDGIWEGAAYQINTKTTWTIKLTARNNTYFVEYPSLSCGGEWALVDKSFSSARFKEKITYGIGRCVDDGDIIIERVSDSQISFKYIEPNSTVIMASAILNKK